MKLTEKRNLKESDQFPLLSKEKKKQSDQLPISCFVARKKECYFCKIKCLKMFMEVVSDLDSLM